MNVNFGKYAKAIIAFISLVVTNVAYRVSSGEDPIPTDVKGWILLVTTTAAGTFLTWAKSNKGFVDAATLPDPEGAAAPVATETPAPKRRPIV